MKMKKSVEERIAATMKKVREGDPNMWRNPLAEATVALLEEGIPVTIEGLIERLDITGDGPTFELKRPGSEAAMERLRQIVVKQD